MKGYEQIISTLLPKSAELEKVVKEQALRITDLERRLVSGGFRNAQGAEQSAHIR